MTLRPHPENCYLRDNERERQTQRRGETAGEKARETGALILHKNKGLKVTLLFLLSVSRLIAQRNAVTCK